MPISIETLVFGAFLVGVGWGPIFLKLLGFDIVRRSSPTNRDR